MGDRYGKGSGGHALTNIEAHTHTHCGPACARRESRVRERHAEVISAENDSILAVNAGLFI